MSLLVLANTFFFLAKWQTNERIESINRLCWNEEESRIIRGTKIESNWLQIYFCFSLHFDSISFAVREKPKWAIGNNQKYSKTPTKLTKTSDMCAICDAKNEKRKAKTFVYTRLMFHIAAHPTQHFHMSTMDALLSFSHWIVNVIHRWTNFRKCSKIKLSNFPPFSIKNFTLFHLRIQNRVQR